MLELPSSWMWDFRLADDGERYHLFFLADPVPVRWVGDRIALGTGTLVSATR
jgi:hypothetical protein